MNIETAEELRARAMAPLEKEESLRKRQAWASPVQTLCESIEPVDLLETLTEKLGDSLAKYRNTEGAIDPYKVPQNLYVVAIVHEIILAAERENLGLCVRHGQIYGFVGSHWVEISDDELKKYLGKMAIRLGYHSPATARVSDFRDKIFRQFVADGIEGAPEPATEGPTLINLRNGTLEIDGKSVRLREHRREDFLVYRLDYDYRPEADAPIFRRYLEHVLPERESRMILQEFLGYCFVQNLKIEKAMVLFGEGGNGKSVLFEIVTAIFGQENIAHKGLGELCQKGDRGNNHRAEAENKLLNYSSELNPAGADIDIFKAITSGEPITGRRLYKDAFSFRPTVKLLFNANTLPSVTERTDAYFRRLLIVPFDVRIKEEERDVELHKKIIDSELPGVLNWIIEGLKRIITNKRFTPSPKADAALRTYKEESNSVAQFIRDYNLLPSLSEFLPNAELYRSYSEFCNDSGYRRLSKVNFGKELNRLGFESARKRVNGKLSRGFRAEIGE